MICKLHACLLALPMLAAVNAKRYQVMHSSGQKRHEARLAKQALAKSEHAVSFLKEVVGCEEHGEGCWFDSDCCGDMECLGVVNWECGHTPGHVGEYCNLAYPCNPDLTCHEGICTDYADILERSGSEGEGTCKEGGPPEQLTVMTYNLFLLTCPINIHPEFPLNPVPCQTPADRAERVGRLSEWFQTRDEDVVVFQEMFTFQDEMIEGMVAAGYCHFVASHKETDGDGTATFSKYPIGEVDFWDYYDWTGEESEGIPAWQVEAMFTDRGVMHAEVLKGGRRHHVYNTHTLSNSMREEHLRRRQQYQMMKVLAEGKSADDLVLYAGDMNEDQFTYDYDGPTKQGDLYYRQMLDDLDATDPEVVGDQVYSYDNVVNALTADVYHPPEEGISQERLDYVLYSNAHLEPSDSSCEISTPKWPENCDGSGAEDIECNLSDHLPVTCTFTFGGTSVASE